MILTRKSFYNFYHAALRTSNLKVTVAGRQMPAGTVATFKHGFPVVINDTRITKLYANYLGIPTVKQQESTF